MTSGSLERVSLRLQVGSASCLTGDQWSPLRRKRKQGMRTPLHLPLEGKVSAKQTEEVGQRQAAPSHIVSSNSFLSFAMPSLICSGVELEKLSLSVL